MKSTAPGSLCLDFPLRLDYLAQVIVPRNMTVAEAKRLSAFIESLVLPNIPRDSKPEAKP